MDTISFQEFKNIEIVAGTIITAELNPKARNPAYVLEIDFGSLGIKKSSAQLCDNYQIHELINKQIIAVMNFEPIRVAGIKSEVLVLAIVCSSQGTVLVCPDKKVKNGERLM
jgi:tRNA-binding protein